MERPSTWLTDDVADLHRLAMEFYGEELKLHGDRWDAEKRVDRDFWLRAGRLGLICSGVPSEYGGGGGSILHDFAGFDAQGRLGFLGFGNAVHSGIVAHYLLAYGSEEQKRRWLPRMATGELISAIAMTEPRGGSDLKMLRTSAARRGDGWVVNGSKTFISNGGQADLVIVAAKTDPAAGAKGISLLMVETADAPGFAVGRVLDKMGMKAQDTAELFFDDVEVPASNLIGDEGAGFGYLMSQLPQERLILAVSGLATLEAALAETVAYVKQREAFGGSLMDLQNTRFELAECATIARIARVFVDDCIALHAAGELSVETASMAKWWVTEMQCQVIDRCLQLFGGYGYMMEYPIARMYVDARVQKIHGGANEVMKELIARTL